MNEYKLTVIVPFYNAEHYIVRCLTSLLEQSLKEIEYILIDDGSTDSTVDAVYGVLDQYPNRKDNTMIIKHRANKGLAYTRTEGLKAARGEYVVFCDADDWVDPDYYRSMYVLGTRERADMVVGRYIVEDSIDRPHFTLPHWADWDSFFRHPKWEFLALWIHMIRLDFIKSNRIYFYEGVDYAEDYGLLFRCYYHSKKNISCADGGYYHYSKDNSASLTKNKYRLKNLTHKQKCLELISSFIRDQGYNPSENTILRDEKMVVKEGFLMAEKPEYKRWKDAFPEISRNVMVDSKLNIAYRACWFMGQYISPVFMRLYMWGHSKMQRNP